MQNSGLTNLKEKSDVRVDSTLLPPGHQVRTHLAELQGEIASLEKIKDSLGEDIKNLKITYDGQKNIYVQDIERFKVQRKTLISMIKKLTPKVAQLEGELEGYSSGYKKFGEERITALFDLAREIEDEAGVEKIKLSKEAAGLNALGDFLVEFSAYYENLAEIVEAETALNDRRGADFEKRDEILVDRLELAKADGLATKEALKNAKTKEKAIETKYEEVDRISKFFEETFDVERKALDKKQRQITSDEKEVAATKKFQDAEKIRLANWERKLVDKQATLVRAARELERKTKEN